MVMKIEVLLALCAVAAALPTPNGGDGLINDLLDANIGAGNQDESTHVSSSHGHGWKKRNGGDGLLNDLIDANIGGDNQGRGNNTSSSQSFY